MQRIVFAILAVLVAAALVSAATYGAGLFAQYGIRAMTHVRPGATMVVSMMTSIGAMYFCLWIAMRQHKRGQ
jgi:hypothetical protein